MKHVFLSTTALAVICLNSAFAEEVAPPSPHHEHDLDEVFVSASPHAKSRLDVLQGTIALSEKDIDRQLDGSIGETLSGLPGISSTFFGPGASRPIIRGQGGDRLRVLINGIGSIDASSTSPDHAVAGDPLTAKRIEVLKGASTLLYGTNAVAGVVNIIDDSIPSEVPENGVEGRARASFGTAADDVNIGASINAAVSDEFVIHLDGFYRDTADYDIPGFAESERLRALEEAEEEEHEDEDHEDEHEEEEEAFGTVENSDLENYGGTIGFAWIGDDARFGASLTHKKNNYGVPGGHGHGHEEEHEGEDEDHDEDEHEEEEEEVVRIDLEQTRFDLLGEITREFAIFESAKLRFGYADYEHVELEGDEIGTVFSNEGWEGRLEFVQKEMGAWHGSMGIQLRSRDFSAIGEEAFVPPTETFQFGIFIIEEVNLEDVTIDFGARYDHQDTENQSLNIDRDFNLFSFSAGAGWHPSEDTLVGLNFSRTERAPTPEELFSDGPHLATNAFEIGDPNLEKEVAYNLEATFKTQMEDFNASLNLYYTWYENFIYEAMTGAEEDELPVFQFFQQDASFYGVELEASYRVIGTEDYDVYLDVKGDLVRGELETPVDGSAYLPRIPADSLTLGASYVREIFDVRGEVRFVADQNRISANELATDGYTELNLEAAWRPLGDEQDLTVLFQAKNLTNEERRLHSSFLKDLIPLPGRSFKISVTAGF